MAHEQYASYDKLIKIAASNGFIPMLMNFNTGELFEIHDYIAKYGNEKRYCMHNKGTYTRTRTFKDGTTHIELVCGICNKHIKWIKSKGK